MAAIDLIFHKGQNKETYNVGGFNEWKNIDLVRLLCKLMDDRLDRPEGTSERLITFVKDRQVMTLDMPLMLVKSTKN